MATYVGGINRTEVNLLMDHYVNTQNLIEPIFEKTQLALTYRGTQTKILNGGYLGSHSEEERSKVR